MFSRIIKRRTKVSVFDLRDVSLIVGTVETVGTVAKLKKWEK